MPPTDQHVGITVSALDDAIDFFAAAFGATVLRRFTPGPHPGVRALVGDQDADLSAAFITFTDGRTIELLEFRNAPAVTSPTPSLTPSPLTVGAMHLSVVVPDLAATVKIIEGLGGSMIGSVVQLDDRATAYVRSPDGTMLELIEGVAA